MKRRFDIEAIIDRNIPANTEYIKALTKDGPKRGTLYVDIVRKGIRKFQAEMEWNGEMLTVTGKSRKEVKKLLVQRISETF